MKNEKKEITLSELVNMTDDQVLATDPTCALFYDWWCKSESLPNKAKRLLAAVRAIVKTGTKAFDPKKTYVFFKNNCPCCGCLYDDLRICDIESGEVLFNVCPSKKAVYWTGNGWNGTEFGSMKELKDWFKNFEAA